MRVKLDLLDRYEEDEAALASDEFIELEPVKSSEFVCPSCFLICHHSQLRGSADQPMCRDCAIEAGLC